VTLDEIFAQAQTTDTKKPWKIQECLPRDLFEHCTLTIEQWLANEGPGSYRRKTDKWQAIMEASALALPRIASHRGLRQEPRVGYDPGKDQPFFIFKASHAGITFLVSPDGIELSPNIQVEE
jgi:hypothetical protein